ncbi:MAG: hypothetical protein A3H72_01060 [Candidatus Doudnabacteria bacterium RIFCSPLOWO2_02_FULL_48_8]|uniref:Non-canonical purine NTP pyrophosphatase n=1 Tax=Candidatus Doudnabacteria bacterium RIFCSPHIGHO2_01_FULL_46_24 TaxID=1817825 RepID=A0A1F5NUS4_9BACT|nr:MAG: hypothetical protein A2720_02615 [Candidatus Doudnabacteria bacterium RIFCSPHIGHO2_01_FULL_46_24]OGE94242.1 MAG: hypothetical protein A3E98_00260 [Candidatus Doudnabacteria bacterium RIFCSPHIGHO2_12_FULL_48_11]OGE94993.1 MAG: hypothetical protein A3H72_01060 [Candidatus Doudnabacteria bacterium RIFCSPLOWO2_02_FULL_48_8]
MSKKLLIGTGNQAKVNSYKKFLKDFKLEIVSAGDLKIPEPEEKSETFEEEAINKAKYYFEKSHLPTLVDDGGMEIDALGGEPGVRSRRWLGHEMKDQEIIAEVMRRMQGVPAERRTCKFSIVIALATPFGIFTSHGEIAGVIADKPSEKIIPRYPYRSVTFLPNYKKYWCEIDEEEEKILDHRKHALEKLTDIFKEISKQ